MSDRLLRLHSEHGQSPWLDNLKRSLLDDGSLATLRDAGVRGLTSNPTIFQKALSHGAAYDAQFTELLAETDDPTEIFFRLALDDIRAVALPVLRHRILLNFQAEADGIEADHVVRRLLETVTP